jgi:hypothetical protein
MSATQNATKIRLAEQALAAHRARLATAADKDSVRRSIKAMQARLAELRATDLPKGA